MYKKSDVISYSKCANIKGSFIFIGKLLPKWPKCFQKRPKIERNIHLIRKLSLLWTSVLRVQTIYRIVVTRLALKETQKELPYPEFSYLNLPNLKVPKSYKITYQIHFELVLRTPVFM